MTQKLEEEQTADEEQKQKFECWCKQNNDDKSELGPKIDRLGTQIRTSNIELNKAKATMEKADAIRKQQLEAFKEDEASLLASVDQASKAITALNSSASAEMKAAYAANAGSSLLQMPPAELKALTTGLRQVMENRGALVYSKLSSADRVAIDDFIRDPFKVVKGNAFLQRDDPTSTSSSIVGILKTMLDDFNEDLQKEVTEEKENDRSYKALIAAKTSEKKVLKEQIVKKTQEKSDAESLLETSKQDIKTTTKAIAADVKFQAAVENRCTKSDDKFKERMQSRMQEMTAVSKTIQVLRSEESRDLFGKTVSFLQQSAHARRVERSAAKAGAFLLEQGRRLGVQRLITVGLQSRIDSFTKVKAAIEEMITALKKEQEDEIKHKEMCVDDLDQNKINTEEKQGVKTRAEDKITALKKKVSECEAQIASLNAEIAEMQKQVQIAGQSRQKENVKFQTEADDQRQTQVVLKKAVKFLEDFYRSSERASLAQITAHRADEVQPEDVGGPEGFQDYKKNAGGAGAMGLIETIIADSAKLEAEAVQAEQEAQSAYESFVAETAENIKAKTAEIDSKTKEKVRGKPDPSDHVQEEATPDYPLWRSVPIELGKGLEYKYVRLKGDGEAVWEFDGHNRCVSPDVITTSSVVDDGDFGGALDEAFCYPKALAEKVDRGSSFNLPDGNGMQLVVIGDDSGAGHGAKGYNGWAAQLGKLLNQQYGYGYCNAAEIGSCVQETLKKGLSNLLPKPIPQVVVFAFSMELRWLATCPEWDRQTIYDNTMKAFAALAAEAWDMGIMPVFAGLTPNSGFEKQQAKLLRDADNEMKRMGVPVLDWLHVISRGGDNFGTWAEGLAHSAIHPNTSGHERMFSAIDISIFQPQKVKELLQRREADLKDVARTCFEDGRGMVISYHAKQKELIVENNTDDQYELNPGWGDMQAGLSAAFREAPWSLQRGLYLSHGSENAIFSIYLGESGTLQSIGQLPPRSVARLRHLGRCLERLPPTSQVLFRDDNLQVVKTETGSLQLFNQAASEYNVHPMWYDVRQATKTMEHGVYEDVSGQAFRTAIISCHGLQSRVKVPARSAVELQRVGDLQSIKQVAVLPLGDRCSTRMLLHKIEYDGPCYPFDLTRTTSLGDVVDMVATGFSDMWNPDQLYYDGELGRVFHRKWSGLSFAHEVEYENGEDPIGNFAPIIERMRKRYSGRAARFDWACKNADHVLFVRTGVASRGEVCNLQSRMLEKYPGLEARLLLISEQDTSEFSGLKDFIHVRESFDPDRMYEDMNYWINCAHRFRGILDSVGVTARTLYWCPNDLKEAEKERQESSKGGQTQPAGDLAAPKLTSEVAKFSHANLYELHQEQVTPEAIGA
ncbi:unnamed protein product [Symbiodinium pilosum]|uniref:Uncharacterized protein n=1 Tax=Symbiodinium pilosum TaxID=2952 RepID=A0A812MHQ5_SYMPI|nr:unnamed protein product [Symbiodinium pilosum]